MAVQHQQEASSTAAAAIGWKGVHHVGFLVQDLDKSRQFYEGILGLKLNPERPDDRLPYGAAQFLIEVPYMLCMSIYYVIIVYAVIGFDWEAGKFFWCGFIIAEPDTPGWWIWLYYLNPVSWLLYGFVASQLGQDVTTIMKDDGTITTVKGFLKHQFNCQYDRLWIAVVVLLAYLCIFWLGSATALKRINFQKR